MRVKGHDRRAALRRLDLEARLAALRVIASLGRESPRWTWAELIEIAATPPHAESPFARQVRRALRVPLEDVCRLRSEAASVLASRWKCLETQEKGAAIAVASSELQRFCLSNAITESQDLAEGCLDLATSLGEPRSSRIASLLAIRGNAQAERELLDSVSRATGRDLATTGVVADGQRCLEIAEGMALSLEQGVGSDRAPVARGWAWAVWAVLEGVRGVPGGRRYADALTRESLASDTPIGRALGGVLRWDRDPLIRVGAWRWLSVDGLAGAALDRLSRSYGVADHEAVLRVGHLAARPARSARLAVLGAALNTRSSDLAPGGVLPTAAELERLSPGARRHVPRLVSAIEANDGTRSVALEPLLTDDDESVRLAVAARAPAAELRDLCFDASERVARVAIHQWSRCGVSATRRRGVPPEISRVLEALSTSPHRHVRRVAREDRASLVTEPVVGPSSRLRVLRAARDNAAEFVRSVRARLLDPRLREPALLEAEVARVLPAIEADLVRLARDPTHDRSEDARFFASVARCLRVIGTPAAHDALELLLESADARVRANAIDSIVLGPWSERSHECEDATVGRLLELKSDPAHRVRGAVARGLAAMAVRDRVDQAGASEAIRTLVADSRAEHVAAGLWAASRAMHVLRDESLRGWLKIRANDVRAEFPNVPPIRSQSCALLARLGHRAELGVRSWSHG